MALLFFSVLVLVKKSEMLIWKYFSCFHVCVARDDCSRESLFGFYLWKIPDVFLFATTFRSVLKVLKFNVNRFLNLPITRQKKILELILERDSVDPLFNLTAF